MSRIRVLIFMDVGMHLGRVFCGVKVQFQRLVVTLDPFFVVLKTSLAGRTLANLTSLLLFKPAYVNLFITVGVLEALRKLRLLLP